jgi:TolB-like protein
MSDVFISYGHSTAARQARGAADALRALGYSVWLDDDLPAHRAFTPEIEAQLTAAKAALVIWSAEGAKSHWVLSEANRAREDNKLLQLRIDGARLPMPFDQIQCADLSGWSGEGEHPAWGKVAASVQDLVRPGALSLIAAVTVPATTAPAEPLLAVLAFDNLSGDPEMAYFSDGVSEEILDTVARGSDLRVIAPSSSFQFRGPHKAVRSVAANLKATHLLDGSVRRSGSRVRIAARLIECAGETTIWSNRFDRELANVFELQDEIAEAVASALKIALAPTPKPSVIRPETYEAYLRAQPLVHTITWHIDEAAARLLEQAVAGAPTFAAAWESLAVARAKLLRSGGSSQPYVEARAGVVHAAETALRLDPTRGRAQLAISLLEPWAAYAQREAGLDRALAANENDSLLILWRSMQLSFVGRARAALDEAYRAAALDPLLTPFRQSMIATPLGHLGRYQESLKLWDEWLREPERANFLGALGHAANMGDWERFDRYEALLPPGQLLGEPASDRLIRRSFAILRTNDQEAKVRAVGRARVFVRETGTYPLDGFGQLASFGLRDEAYELAEAASFDHMFRPDGPLPAMTYGPHVIFERYRDGGLPADPRFLRLCGKLGLVSYWMDTGNWPDCADEVPYDFRAEARKVAAEGLARRGLPKRRQLVRFRDRSLCPLLALSGPAGSDS